MKLFECPMASGTGIAGPRLSSLRQSKYRSRPNTQESQATHHYDDAAGLEYTEVIAPLPESEGRNWTKRSVSLDRAITPSSLDPRAVEHQDPLPLPGLQHMTVIPHKEIGPVGAPSLQNMAIKYLLSNMARFTAEEIQSLPVTTIRRAQEIMEEESLVCFDTWKIFSPMSKQENNITLSRLRFRQTIMWATAPVNIYTSPLTSNTFQFLTSLTISVRTSHSELVELRKITNLAVLEITNCSGFPFEWNAMGDRLMKAWHLAALHDDAFQVLRHLKLWYFEDLTEKSLNYLDAFPALAVFEVQGMNYSKGIKGKAQNLGWELQRSFFAPEDLQSFLQTACAARTKSVQEAMGIPVQPPRNMSADRLNDNARILQLARKDATRFLADADYPGPCRLTSDARVFGEVTSWIDEKGGHLKTAGTRRFSIRSANFKDTEAWAFTSYAVYARIGELRNDSDLARAGIDISSQPVADDEFVPPLPMACLRLITEEPDYSAFWGRLWSATARNAPLSFIRVQPTFVKIKDIPAQQRPTKRGLWKKKRESLSALLGSFL